LVFDGRKGMENNKRDFEEYMKSREDELRTTWLQEEPKGPGRWTGEYSLGLALRTAKPTNIAAAYRRVGANPKKTERHDDVGRGYDGDPASRSVIYAPTGAHGAVACGRRHV
jgi:hypothetical protein